MIPKLTPHMIRMRLVWYLLILGDDLSLSSHACVQPKDSGAPKTGDMMMGRPVAKFYEAVTTTEQTVF